MVEKEKLCTAEASSPAQWQNCRKEPTDQISIYLQNIWPNWTILSAIFSKESDSLSQKKHIFLFQRKRILSNVTKMCAIKCNFNIMFRIFQIHIFQSFFQSFPNSPPSLSRWCIALADVIPSLFYPSSFVNILLWPSKDISKGILKKRYYGLHQGGRSGRRLSAIALIHAGLAPVTLNPALANLSR